MESLIYENFKPGCPVEVFLKSCCVPIEAKIMKLSHSGILLKSDNGRKTVIPLSEIGIIRQAVLPSNAKNSSFTKDKDKLFNQVKTFTHNSEQPANDIKRDSIFETGNTQPANESDASSVEKISEIDTEFDNETSTEPVGERSTIASALPETKVASNVFKLPSETPRIKILGSIELDDTDKYKKRFKDNDTIFNRPKIEDNFFESTLPVMGTLKSVGPVYGYIKMPEGNDLYCNRGEFIFLPEDNIDLIPGMPLSFSIGSNWKGMMAKCIHRPYTVAEQLDLIENIISSDLRNARLLAKQLVDAFPDNKDVEEALQEFPELGDF